MLKKALLLAAIAAAGYVAYSRFTQAQEERERAEEDGRGEGYVEVRGMVWHVHERCRGEGRVPVSRAKGYGTM